jgi:hypothetical protein
VTVRIVKATQTQWALPSRWEAVTDDGRELLLRFRYGRGTARVMGEEPIATFYTGDRYDGCIDLQTFCDLAGLELAVGDDYVPMTDPNEGYDFEEEIAFLDYLIEKTKRTD